jgi:hypothetical protein
MVTTRTSQGIYFTEIYYGEKLNLTDYVDNWYSTGEEDMGVGPDRLCGIQLLDRIEIMIKCLKNIPILCVAFGIAPSTQS